MSFSSLSGILSKSCFILSLTVELRDENDNKNRWNLLDYGDVIVHVLHRDERETYALEKFWNHALKMEREEWEKESEEYSEYTK